MCVPDAGVAESVIWPEVVPGKTTELLVPLIVTLIFYLQAVQITVHVLPALTVIVADTVTGPALIALSPVGIM